MGHIITSHESSGASLVSIFLVLWSIKYKVVFIPPWSLLIPLQIHLQVVESPNSVKLIMPATIEELQGIVAGLVGIIKDLTTNVTQVTQTVGNMADMVPASIHHDNTQDLCMPSMQLPSFCLIV